LLSYDNLELAHSHPCYHEKAHFRIGRIHLPVARNCNIGCNFCDKKISSFYHTSRPGLAYQLMKPDDVVFAVEKAISDHPNLEVVGIAGPGEPLYNPETFDSLKLVSKQFPYLKLCICTNGLLLSEKAKILRELNVTSLTVTINAVNPNLASKISSYSIINGKKIKGEQGARELITRQLEGLRTASELGFLIKVNTVLIPEINMDHIQEIAYEVKNRGAYILNIMPLIPLGNFANKRAPTCDELIQTREIAESIIPIFRACKQCRADACGIPGKEHNFHNSNTIT
jgi:nitrogen fixation protein NifB